MTNGIRTDDPIDAFLAAVSWNHYVGATLAFAGLRREGTVRNLACRVVLRARPPAPQWGFFDEIEELVIRRGWIPIERLHETLSGLHDNRIPLDDEDLRLLRDQGVSYGWTRLIPGPRGRKIIGWRASSLNGSGENQSLFLGYEAFGRLASRLRVMGKRPFDGWANLAAFLGEGEGPLELGERFNTNLECFAPLYARIEPEPSLDEHGVFSVSVQCVAPPAAGTPRLFLAPLGADPPRSLHLAHLDGDTWRCTEALSSPAEGVKLTLMLGQEVADEVALSVSLSPAALTPESWRPKRKISSGRGPGDALTLVERWKRWASNQPIFAGLIVLCIAVIGIGGVAKAIIEIRDLFSPDKRAESPTSSSPTGHRAPAPSPRLLETISRMKRFDRFRADTASSEEAVLLLRASGLDRITTARGLEPVTAQVDDVWCITIWPQSYGRRNTYGVRYAPCSSEFEWNAQKTYFDVVIPLPPSP